MIELPTITLPSYFDYAWTTPALILVALILVGAAVVDTLLLSKGEHRASRMVLFIAAPLAATGILVALVAFSPVGVADRGKAERAGLEVLGQGIVETYDVDAVSFGKGLKGSNTPLCLPGASDERFTVQVEVDGEWEDRTLVRLSDGGESCTYALDDE